MHAKYHVVQSEPKVNCEFSGIRRPAASFELSVRFEHLRIDVLGKKLSITIKSFIENIFPVVTIFDIRFKLLYDL